MPLVNGGAQNRSHASFVGHTRTTSMGSHNNCSPPNRDLSSTPQLASLAGNASRVQQQHQQQHHMGGATTATNVSIATDSRPALHLKRVQLKQTSFRIPRVPSAALDAETIRSMAGRLDAAPNPPKRNNSIYKAAEKGRGELLPTSSHQLPNRVRTLSSSNESSWGRGSIGRTSSGSRSLRSRTGRRSTVDDFSPTDHGAGKRRLAMTYSSTHDKPPLRGNITENVATCTPTATAFSDQKSSSFLNSSFMQTLALLILTCLVWDSYHRAVTTSEQFEKLKHDESILNLNLEKLVQAVTLTQEDLGRLADGTVEVKAAPIKGHKESEPLDSKLIREQTQQLYQMEEELNHELRGLKASMQHGARANIVNAFGEGPIQVSFDLDFGNTSETQRISVSLWYDTPYAAWTLIDQVQQGRWAGSKFKFDKGVAVSAAPLHPDPSKDRLDFIERSQKSHEAWTVGLTENEAGGLSLFINLQDNTAYRKNDVCVGKIVEGFGTLQKLIEQTRRLEGTDKFVTIKGASASRLLTKVNKEGASDHGPQAKGIFD